MIVNSLPRATFAMLLVMVLSTGMTEAQAKGKQQNVSKHEITVEWSFSGHRSSSNADRERRGEKELIKEGKQIVESWNLAPSGPKYKFVGIKFNGIFDVDSDTSSNWKGERKHKAWGKAKGQIIYSVQK